MDGVYLMSIFSRNLPGWQVENKEDVAKFLATWFKNIEGMSLAKQSKTNDFFILISNQKVGQLAYLRKK